jgi:hypothetical protein
MKRVYSPNNEIDLAFIKGILDGEGISYFVLNDHFGSLQIGPQIPLYNQRAVMVDEVDEKKAKELIEDYLSSIQSEVTEKVSSYSLGEKIRMFAEISLFGWIMPGKPWGMARGFRRRDTASLIICSAIVISMFLAILWFAYLGGKSDVKVIPNH